MKTHEEKYDIKLSAALEILLVLIKSQKPGTGGDISELAKISATAVNQMEKELK